MAKKIVKLPSLSRVVAGSVATLELPKGPTYKRVIFTVTGTSLAASHLEKMEFLINGKPIQSFKNLQRLMDLNGYYKRGADAVGQFVWHFERPELHALADRRGAGIGTVNVDTAHFEIQLAVGAPANIAIVAHAEVETIPQPLGAFVRIREYPTSSAVAGRVEIDKLPRGSRYLALHCFKSDVTGVELTVNGAKVIEATKAILERSQKEATPKERVPVTASCTHVDLMTEGDIGQSLLTEGVSDFRLGLDLATLGAVDIVAETLDNRV